MITTTRVRVLGCSYLPLNTCQASVSLSKRNPFPAEPRSLGWPAFISSVALSIGIVFSPLAGQAATSPVGATAGSFAVSPSGAATYSIPIIVPPGINGMAPSISLNYNSQGGNGLVGMGWSIGGLSVIHRCGATIAIDGFKGGVNYDANDRFCLDGERLIWDTATGSYRTQHESWQKIVFSGSADDPSSFTVTGKDGTTRYYGLTADSRIEAAPFASNGQTRTVARTWALNKIQDTNGNYLVISYQEDNAIGEYYPVSIAYTGNGIVAPYNFVFFEYPVPSRSDVMQAYDGGSLISTTKLLTGIRTCTDSACTQGSTLVRKYVLGYVSNGAAGRSRLMSIQECGTDSVCLPTTTFSWQDGSIGFNAATQWVQVDFGSYTSDDPARMQYADITGDGKADALYFQLYSLRSYVWAGTSTGTTFNPLSQKIYYYPPTDLATHVQYADVNGDGMLDVLKLNYDLQTIMILVSISNYGNFTPSQITRTEYPSAAWINLGAYNNQFNAAQVQYADVDGDGRADLLYQGLDNTFKVALSRGNSFAPLTLWTQHGGSFVAGQAQYADVNGDGKTDLIFQDNNNAFWVSLSTGTGFTTPVQWVQQSGSFTAGQARYADVNGDGKADLIFQGNDGQLWVSLSTGMGFTAQVAWVQPATSLQVDQVQYADANGDGMADAMYFNVNDNSIWVYLSTGTGFLPGTMWGQLGSGVSVGSQMRYADVNGDGLPDALYFDTFQSKGVWVSKTKGVPPDLVTSVTNGLGATTAIAYKPLSDSSVHSCGAGAYPYKRLCDATYVVSGYTQSNGIGGVNSASYWYSGMLWHHEAATRIGFANTRITDATGVTLTAFNQTLDGTEGTVAMVNAWDINWRRIKDVSNTWQPSPLGAGRTLALLTASAESNDVLGTTANTAYSNYDAYGNPSTVVVSFNDGWSKTTTNTYNNDTTNWFLGQLLRSEVTAQATGQTALTRTSSFTYDSLGRLASETIEPDSTTLKLTSTYVYDTFGNRTKKTVSGPGITTRDDYILTFDTRGQFVANKKNALGHTEIYNSYDPRNGAVTGLTDPNGLPFASEYNDGFARKTKETRPDGTYTTYAYNGCDSTCPALAMTMTQTYTLGAGTAWVYRDMFGREVRRQTQGLGGAWIYQDTAYDNLGRVVSVSHPYYSGEALHYTTSVYDVLGRTVSVTESGSAGSCNGPGRTTVTAYSGLITTVTNPLCQQKSAVKNSQGLVVSSTDAAGTVSYTYDPFGNLIQATGVDNTITSMKYDIRGNKFDMVDPDMGHWTYTYNTLGQLKTQIDAKGQKISMTYDKLGRMTSRTPLEGFSYWTYDTATYGKGKLAYMGNSTTNEIYTYDSLGRPSAIYTSIGGVTYTVAKTYDIYSRVDTLTYPETGFSLRHCYDSYGYLARVEDATNTPACTGGAFYWTAGAADAHGRLTAETFGNGLTTQHAYNHESNDLVSIQTGTATSPASVQNSSFSFDALGNLTARSWWDGAATRTETFRYDEDGLGLNRLTSVTGPANKIYAYYLNGNIQNKSDVGQYTYPTNGIQPHAVTQVTGALNTTYTYDANGNMLSGNGRTIAYTSFNKPKTIAQGTTTDSFTYDANFNRLIKTTGSTTTTYIGKLYENIENSTLITQNHFIYAGPNLVGVYKKFSNNTTSTQYFHTDHLGSVDTITNASGGVQVRYSYDAHGKRRYASGTDVPLGTNLGGNRRGFTRHEHDDEVGLVNMNAREYDYVLGRFITPDTIIPGGTNSQAFNRYSYVNNNPLSFTDPSGHRSWRKLIRKIYQAEARIQVASAYVGAGFLMGGPTGAVAGARAFYESNKVYNAGGNTGDILKTGAASGVGTYATLEGIGGMYDSWINGIVQTQSMFLATGKVAAQQYINAQFRDAVGRYAASQGYSLTEFNLGLFGISALGNGIAGSRLKSGMWENTEWGIRGFGQRTNPIIGLPFDVVDTVLAFQGIPTASAVQYVFSSQRGMPLTGHSLGALDVANLSGFGLAGTSSRVYALPFGKVASGAGVTIGSGDAINGFGLGTLFNPDAAVVDTGFLGHACSLYPGCGQ